MPGQVSQDIVQATFPARVDLSTEFDLMRAFWSEDYWAQRAHETSDNRGKLLRRDGFGLAEDRYGRFKTDGPDRTSYPDGYMA